MIENEKKKWWKFLVNLRQLICSKIPLRMYINSSEVFFYEKRTEFINIQAITIKVLSITINGNIIFKTV